MTIRLPLYLIPLLFVPIYHSAIVCFEYDNRRPELTNKTIRCPDPADTCFTERSSRGGQLLSRSCVWKGHCTEKTICGKSQSRQCDLHCCHTPLCNGAVGRRLGKSELWRLGWIWREMVLLMTCFLSL